MRWSVCIPAVFRGKPLVEGIRRASACGMKYCEIWTWWDQDLDAVSDALKETGMQLTAMCTPFISLTDPACREEYRKGLVETLAAAKKLGCPRLIAQVGADTGAPREVQHASIVDGLKEMLPLLEQSGIVLVIEPLNTLVDHVGYYLSSAVEGFEIVREVNSPYVRMLYDIYHQQIMEGSLIVNMTSNVELIGHVHIAGVPGRHEPLDNCEINYPVVLSALKKAGYTGVYGLEYTPVNEPEIGLKAMLELNI